MIPKRLARYSTLCYSKCLVSLAALHFSMSVRKGTLRTQISHHNNFGDSRRVEGRQKTPERAFSGVRGETRFLPDIFAAEARQKSRWRGKSSEGRRISGDAESRFKGHFFAANIQ